MKGSKIARILLVLCVFLIAGSAISEAVVIGANKGVINFNNVLKNGYSRELVTLSTDSEYNISVTYTAEGEVAEWIRFEPVDQPFYISKNNPYTIGVIVEPPADARIAQYNGMVRFMTGALAGPEGQFGTSVRTAINLRMNAQVTGQEQLSCRLSDFTINDFEEGYPMEVRATISNEGNVRVKPRITMEFWNQDQTEVVDEFSFTIPRDVLPTVEERFMQSIDQDLPIGQYWVKVDMPMCGPAATAFITTSVIERGGVSDKGELIAIENNPWVKVGDIIPIDAVFVNTGSRVVSAKFKGSISSGEEIFKIIDTDLIDVLPGQTARLRTYFNPTQEGQYVVTGRVLYNKKLTFDKTSVINVNPTGRPPGTGGMSLGSFILPALIVIIILLVVLILRKRQQMQGRF